MSSVPAKKIPTVVLPEGKEPVARPDAWFVGRSERSASRGEAEGAKAYELPERARVAVDTALALGEPLLVTGAPGTGKTTLAWYLARILGVGEPFTFQVQSTSVARDLRYHFDELRRFRDAYRPREELVPAAVAGGGEEEPGERQEKPGSPLAEHHHTLHEDDLRFADDARAAYLEPRALWLAMSRGLRDERPQVLLIDEIDKAPRDFPNDLLQDIDQLRFAVPEVGGMRVRMPETKQDLRPVVVITSNEERELPAPFLRRCICLNLVLDTSTVQKALEARKAELKPPSETFLGFAARRFMEVRGAVTRRKPGTAEAIVWTRALLLHGVPEDALREGTPVRALPLLSFLVKDRDEQKTLLPEEKG